LLWKRAVDILHLSSMLAMVILMTSINLSDPLSMQGVVNKATLWGFRCPLNADVSWKIDSCLSNWSLISQDERWVLRIRSIPQIRFLPTEALAFLRRQRFTLSARP
jgi:hypothetical protein